MNLENNELLKMQKFMYCFAKAMKTHKCQTDEVLEPQKTYIRIFVLASVEYEKIKLYNEDEFNCLIKLAN